MGRRGMIGSRFILDGGRQQMRRAKKRGIYFTSPSWWTRTAPHLCATTLHYTTPVYTLVGASVLAPCPAESTHILNQRLILFHFFLFSFRFFALPSTICSAQPPSSRTLCRLTPSSTAARFAADPAQGLRAIRRHGPRPPPVPVRRRGTARARSAKTTPMPKAIRTIFPHHQHPPTPIPIARSTRFCHHLPRPIPPPCRCRTARGPMTATQVCPNRASRCRGGL